MTIEKWLKHASQTLEEAGIGTARLDCLVLLEDTSQKDRAHLLAHPETEPTPKQLKQLEKLLARRAKHEPLAYIRGKTEFYGREFMMNKHVLEPRPESETMIELLKKVAGGNEVIADIGTGSGALAITAQLELPSAKVFAVDIDPKCLSVAETNAAKLNARVNFLTGDLLEPFLVEKPTILLCNLPYVPTSFHINEAAAQEPRVAIFGGEDGLDLYRRLFTQAEKIKPVYILTESLPFQHAELTKIATHHHYSQQTEDDFIQLFARRD